MELSRLSHLNVLKSSIPRTTQTRSLVFTEPLHPFWVWAMLQWKNSKHLNLYMFKVGTYIPLKTWSPNNSYCIIESMDWEGKMHTTFFIFVLLLKNLKTWYCFASSSGCKLTTWKWTLYIFCLWNSFTDRLDSLAVNRFR